MSLRIALGALGLVALGCSAAPEDRRAASVLAPEPKTFPYINDVLVHVRPGVKVSELWSEYDLWPGSVLPDGVTYRVLIGSGTTQDMILRLQEDDRIAVAEENLPVKSPVFRQTSIAFDEGFLSSSEFFEGTPLAARLHLELAHDGSKGLGVKVAILDTGVNAEHDVLKGRIAPDSYDFLERDSDPSDVPDFVDNDLDGQVDEATGHGTHVTGLVALVAPASQLLCLRVLNTDGQGSAYNVAEAIEYAVNHGARVINLSIRLSAHSATVDMAIQYAKSHGAILVSAAGNYGSAEYPAIDERVWAVAALNAANSPASFTSAFPAVVLSAPGENILSTSWNGGYAVWSGTSMAAPIVSGSAALVLARYPLSSADEVLFRLQTTALQIAGAPSGMGAGGVDPGAAVGLNPEVSSPTLEAPNLSTSN